MRAALSRSCSVLAATLLSWACHSALPAPVGVSTAIAASGPPARAAAPRAVWSELDAALRWPEAAPAVQALAHRRDGTLIHVRVEPSALEAYRELAEESPMPDGARVLAWHESPEGEPLGGYLFEKAGGRWRGRAVDARGALVPGDDAACIRCHDLAPTDHLFGVRTPPPAPTTPAARESTSPTQR